MCKAQPRWDAPAASSLWRGMLPGAASGPGARGQSPAWWTAEGPGGGRHTLRWSLMRCPASPWHPLPRSIKPWMGDGGMIEAQKLHHGGQAGINLVFVRVHKWKYTPRSTAFISGPEGTYAMLLFGAPVGYLRTGVSEVPIECYQPPHGPCMHVASEHWPPLSWRCAVCRAVW